MIYNNNVVNDIIVSRNYEVKRNYDLFHHAINFVIISIRSAKNFSRLQDIDKKY